MQPAIGSALASAALFGASTPLAKLLQGKVSPLLLAVLLYLGSGFGIAAWIALSSQRQAGTPLSRADWPWLAGARLAWAIDNNLTRRVSGGGAATIACLKSLVAGGVNFAIAVSLGAQCDCAAKPPEATSPAAIRTKSLRFMPASFASGSTPPV